jgi:hypothetical protein
VFVESGGRVKIRRVNGKQYLYLGLPRIARGVLAGWTGTPRMLGGGLGALEGLGLVLEVRVGRVALWLVFNLKPQLSSWRTLGLRGDRIIVEREVELETMWNVRRIALDPRVFILYAYAQKYLGYPGSLGEFVSDCMILLFKERGWRLL